MTGVGAVVMNGAAVGFQFHTGFFVGFVVGFLVGFQFQTGELEGFLVLTGFQFHTGAFDGQVIVTGAIDGLTIVGCT